VLIREIRGRKKQHVLYIVLKEESYGFYKTSGGKKHQLKKYKYLR